MAKGRTLTFAAVARGSGLVKATLYRRPELRAIVEQHRRDDREAHSLTGTVTELGLLRQELETVAAKVRLREEQLRQMRRKL